MAIDSKIRQIIDNSGHIKVDEMMRQVLSINHNSYYRARNIIGEKGDFITAPEVSQLFGEIIGVWVVTKWQQLGCPSDFMLLELGPGHGTMMRDLMRTGKLVPEFVQGMQVVLLEINRHFIKKQKENLKFAVQNINWINKIEDLPQKPCIFISNEFFDSLPIKQYIKVRQKWYESVIVCDPFDGTLKFDKIESPRILLQYLEQEHKNAKDGAIFEESIEAMDIMRVVATHLSRFGGAVLAIDYGYNIEPANRTRYQYNPTLQAIRDHKYCPVFESLGEADLTAHVDFNALKNAVMQQGIHDIVISSQADFLINYGILLRHELLQSKASKEEKGILNRQLHRLIDKTSMGEIFKVLEVFSR